MVAASPAVLVPVLITSRHLGQTAVDVPDPVDPGVVQAEDLPLGALGQLWVGVLPAQLLRDLEPPERLDLPLRAAVPDGVGPEEDPVLAEESQPLAEDVRTDGRKGDHGRS